MSFFNNPAINLTVTGWTIGAAVGVYKGCRLMASALTTQHKVKAVALILASINVFAGVFILVKPKGGRESRIVKAYTKARLLNPLRKIVTVTAVLHTEVVQQAIKHLRSE